MLVAPRPDDISGNEHRSYNERAHENEARKAMVKNLIHTSRSFRFGSRILWTGNALRYNVFVDPSPDSPQTANLSPPPGPVRLTAHVPAHLAARVYAFQDEVGLSTGSVIRLALAEFFRGKDSNGKSGR